MNISNNISIFVESQLPEFVRTNGPELTSFMKTYYEWMESDTNPVAMTRQLPSFSDVDLIPDNFFKNLRNQFMKDFPATIADEKILLKNIVDFYKSRGSEKSYRMLFRILFGDDKISFYYPGVDILRASDGRWVVKKSLKFSILGNPDLESIVSIRGQISGAIARKDQLISYLSNGFVVNELFITHIFGEFINDEILVNADTGENFGRLTEPMVVYDGAWEGTNGFLSWDKKLEDNNYYQEFSYEIKSGVSIAQFKEPVYQLVHPTGTKLFAKLGLDIEFNEAQFVNFTFIRSSLDRISISVEIVLYEAPHETIQPLDFSNNYVRVTTPESVVSSEQISVWLNYTIFDDVMRDVSISSMGKYQFFVSNTSTFIFPAWTPVQIQDGLHNANTWFFAEKVVNTSLLILNSAYPYGSVDNLTYKYRILS